MVRYTLIIAGIALSVGAAARGATVTYDVLFTGQEAQRDITVAPGTPVDITVTAQVDPADPEAPDTDGFITVELDLDIDFGFVQTERLSLDPTFASTFPLFASAGELFMNGGISDIRGVQDTFTPSHIHHGMGLQSPMTVAAGTLDTPTTAGAYTIRTQGRCATILDAAPATTETNIPTGAIVNKSLTLRISGGGAPPAPTAAFVFVPDGGDAATILFDASGSTGDGLSYSWDFGDGESGSGVTASHHYADGTWTAVLTVEDSHAVTATQDASIVVSTGGGGGGGGGTPAMPTAAFVFAPDANDSATIRFDASGSTGDGLSYSWNFGDGHSGTGMTTSHKYAEGTWTAILTVVDSYAATATKTASIVVAADGDGMPAAPVAAFSVIRDAGEPATVVLDASGSTGDGLSYSWDFGDGGSGSGVAISHRYANGTWTAALTVVDSHGATATSNASITVSIGGGSNPPPDDGANLPSGGGDDLPSGNGNTPPSDGGSNKSSSPVVVPACGAGITQTAFLCVLGLFAVQLTRRRY